MKKKVAKKAVKKVAKKKRAKRPAVKLHSFSVTLERRADQSAEVLVEAKDKDHAILLALRLDELRNNRVEWMTDATDEVTACDAFEIA